METRASTAAADKVVARFADGRVMKGLPVDFSPASHSFTLRRLGTADVETLDMRDLKAVYYVKYYDGRPFYRKRQGFVRVPERTGRRVIVKFRDGEQLYGITRMYSPSLPGFFVYPADPGSNNERIFVVNGPALEQVDLAQ